MTVFVGSTSVNDGGAGFDVITNNQPRSARGCDDYIILIKLCQVGATMKELDVVAGVGKHFVKRGTDEFAAADDGDFAVFQGDVVASEEPIDSSGGGGVVLGVLSEAVDIFGGSDEVAEFVGLGFVGEGELDDDAAYRSVVICTNDFFSECRSICAKISYLDTNIFAVLFFEIDIFHDDGIARIAQNKETRLFR